METTLSAHQVWLHDFRKAIDANILQAKESLDVPSEGPGRREMEIALTKLQEAKMWVGKVLEAVGSELPAEFRDEAKKIE